MQLTFSFPWPNYQLKLWQLLTYASSLTDTNTRNPESIPQPPL